MNRHTRNLNRGLRHVLMAALLFQLAIVGPVMGTHVPGVIIGDTSDDAFTTSAMKTNLPAAFGKLPLYFIENQGQLDERVAYYVQGSDTTLYFTSAGVTFALTHSQPSSARNSPAQGDAASDDLLPIGEEPGARDASQRWTVKLDFLNANPDARPVAQDQTPAVVSYFKGSRDQWQAGLPTYSTLVYADLWPGIDLVYGGTINRLKYEFVVHPGADPRHIRLAYRGATAVTLNDAGQLEVSTPAGGFTDDAPVAYQELNGRRVGVSVAYALDSDCHSEARSAEESQSIGILRGLAAQNDHENRCTYSFRVGAYDPTQVLALDPSVLVYAGYIGSFSGDGIAVDNAGNAYVVGTTGSDQTTFPVTVGPDLTFNGGDDAFVAKVNATGTALVYAGYIGGSVDDYYESIAVDGAGNAYVAGITESDQTTFPVTVGPDLTYNGAEDAFVAKVNATGTALVYAGYIGGSNTDHPGGIAVDGAGNAYVAGNTGSDQTTFPVTVGPDLTYNGGYSGDAFVAKVNATGTALIYAGYIGGSGDDGGGGIAVDSTGNAYVAGFTASDQTTFPVTVGPDLTYNGGSDAFVAKVNAAGTALVYAGYIGGSSLDGASGIAVDGAGNAYVAGSTGSDQTTFPETVGPDLTFNGGAWGDAFVAKVNAAGTALVYAGYIGGSGDDEDGGIAVDSAGNAYVAGDTTSDQTTFPVTVGPDLTFNGGYDAFVAKVNAAGTALVYAGYIGGSDSDYRTRITVDSAGNAYVVGSTYSDQTTFPVTVGPDLTFNFNGGSDAFVAKIPVNPLLGLFLPLVLRNYCVFGPGECEPNDTSAQANGPLYSGRNYTGYHDYASDDNDYFSLNLSASGTITADLTNYANRDLQLHLYDQTGTNRIGYAGGPPYHIVYSGPAGRYYLRVYTPAGYPGGSPYNLTVTFP